MSIVKTKKAIRELVTGQVLEVHTTDKEAKDDLPAWDKSGGHKLLKNNEDTGVLKF